MDWVEHADGRVSICPAFSFQTQHGQSFCSWRSSEFEQPYAASSVLYPDGSRGIALNESTMIGMFVRNRNPCWRRQLEGQRSWWPGTITIRRDDISFNDFDDLLPLPGLSETEIERMRLHEFGEDRRTSHSLYWPEFYQALCTSPEFLTAIRDDGLAFGLLGVFLSSDLVRISDGKELLVGSDRRYGDMLGALRRVGERYLDFYFGFEYGRRLAQSSDILLLKQMLANVGFTIRE